VKRVSLFLSRVCVGLSFLSVQAFAEDGEKEPVYSFGRLPTELSTNEMRLSADDVVLRALQVNYDVAIRRLDVSVADAGVMESRAEFEPSLFAHGGRSSGTDTNSTQRTDSGEAGIRTRWITGTDLSLLTDYAETNQETGGSARVAVELTQPLLRGAGIKVNQAGMIRARRTRDITVQELKQQMIDTASAVRDRYWDLAAVRESLTVEEDSLKYARDLAEVTRQRAEAGIMGVSDTVEAQAAVYARETDVLRRGESVRRLEDVLKEQLALFEKPEYWNAAIVPTTPPTEPEAGTDFLASLGAALRNRPDYQGELLRLKNADLSLYVAKNELLPRLDVKAAAARTADVDGAAAATDAASSDDEVWSVFLSLEIPLGNKEARAHRDQALAQQQQEVLRLKQVELRIIREVRRAVDSENTTRKVLETTARTVEFEQRKLENERVKLELGKSTTDNVVRFIQSLNGARLNYVQAMNDYNKSLDGLEQVKGTTLNRYEVTIE
jgi:outer membrane protein TolC